MAYIFIYIGFNENYFNVVFLYIFTTYLIKIIKFLTYGKTL
jgi:hypothetical protein